MILENFLGKFKPTATVKATDATVDKYKDIVPEGLMELWTIHGFGKYNNGYLEIINPDDYSDTLGNWLGKRVDTYVPIALTAFGDLYYYRKLTDTDEDVCILEPHYRKIDVCVWSHDEFFNEYLCDERIHDGELRGELFKQAVEKLGELKNGEIYYFVPALILGGGEEIEHVDKGNAAVHLDMLFQMG